MSLTKQDNKVKMVKGLISQYNMPIFAVDLLKDAYDTDDPFEICKLAKEILDIDLEVAEVLNMLCEPMKKLTPRFSLSLTNFFNN